MNKTVLEAKDIFQDYLVYYYTIDRLGSFRKLDKKCFDSKEDIIRFIKEGNYTEIDNIFIKGKRVNYKIETIVEVGDNNE